MTYTLSPTSKPGFPTVTRDDGLSAVFADFGKHILVRVPTEFGSGWLIVGEGWERLIFSPEVVLEGLADGSINPPNEAWA